MLKRQAICHARRATPGTRARFTAVWTSLLLAGLAAQATATSESAKLTGPGEGASLFGRAVSIEGDTILVGAPFDTGGAVFSGAAYAFGFDGSQWALETIFAVADTDDAFGFAVALSGARSAFGAPGHVEAQTASGAVYVFDFDGQDWVQQAILTAIGASDGDKFGSAIALDGIRIVAGAPFDDERGTDAGAAYVFEFDGAAWSQQAKLTASDGGPDENFAGTSVAIDGDVVVVGAPLHGGGSTAEGAAYVFRFDGETWSQEAKLTASDAAPGDNFGLSVSVSGNIALVGSPFHDAGASDSGAAYAFRFDGESWLPLVKLTAPEAVADGNFGVSTAYDGELALVGAPLSSSTGSAYLFLSGSWDLQETLTASDGSTADDFASAVAFSGERAVVGAPFDDPAGTAYVFRLPEPSAQILALAAVAALAGLARGRRPIPPAHRSSH